MFINILFLLCLFNNKLHTIVLFYIYCIIHFLFNVMFWCFYYSIFVNFAYITKYFFVLYCILQYFSIILYCIIFSILLN